MLRHKDEAVAAAPPAADVAPLRVDRRVALELIEVWDNRPMRRMAVPMLDGAMRQTTQMVDLMPDWNARVCRRKT
jgi:hypothetical protein